jgi:Arm DNA-binding domain
VPKHMLSARQVQFARERDTHDGKGLILRVQDKGAWWVLRYRVASGKRRELGLGAADRSSIEARCALRLQFLDLRLPHSYSIVTLLFGLIVHIQLFA